MPNTQLQVQSNLIVIVENMPDPSLSTYTLVGTYFLQYLLVTRHIGS